jgi:GNAT superfamily N-acetyltransferase
VEAIRLRPGTVRDASAITDLFLAARRTTMPYLPALHSDAETRAFIENVVLQTCAVWVADEGGRAVGFAAVHEDWLAHLYLHPAYQRRGIGTALLRRAMELSPDRLQLWAFQRNSAARAFYERHGFHAVEFGDGSGNEEGEPDVRYEWRNTRPT